jgi:hypothetical protein
VGPVALATTIWLAVVALAWLTSALFGPVSIPTWRIEQESGSRALSAGRKCLRPFSSL